MGGETITYRARGGIPRPSNCREWRDIEVQGANMFGIQAVPIKTRVYDLLI